MLQNFAPNMKLICMEQHTGQGHGCGVQVFVCYLNTLLLYIHLLCWQLMPHGDLKTAISISEIEQRINSKSAVDDFLALKDVSNKSRNEKLATKRKAAVENLVPIEEEVKQRGSPGIIFCVIKKYSPRGNSRGLPQTCL